MIEELEHRIREKAHDIWEREGRPAGRADAHWARASAEVAAGAAPGAAKSRARRAPAETGARRAPAKVVAEAAPASKRRSPATPEAN